MASYEEANWQKLSPRFRQAHNRLRILKGLSPIPEPKIDLYVPPAPQPVAPMPMVDDELIGQARMASSRFDAQLGKGEAGFVQRVVPEW